MTDRNLPVLQLSPEHMSPEEQFEAMRVSIKPVVDLYPIRDAESDPFKASSTWYLLDNIAMSKSSYSALRYQRDSKKLKQNDDLESYIFHLALNGSHIGVSGEQELRVKTGGIAVLDTREEIYGQSGDCDLLTVMMPRHLLENADLLHATLPDNCIKTRVLREHMLSLWHALPEIEVTDNSAFSKGLVSLTNALFSTEGTSQDVQALDISVLTAMKNSIEKNLADTRLGVQSLCKEFYCSRAKTVSTFPVRWWRCPLYPRATPGVGIQISVLTIT